MDMSAGSKNSAESTAAGAVCASLHRAYRDLRFYPAEHPSARQTMDALISAVSAFVQQYGSLTLEVQEDVLAYEGEPVYSYDSGRDNLAFLMFRDGVRSLSLSEGISAAEVETFVDCLARADDLAAMEHDLVTALWEQDFAHMDYRVADPFLGGEVLREGMVDALRATVLRRLENSIAAPGNGADNQAWDDVKHVDADQIDLASLVLSQPELERGERAVDSLADVLRDYADVLVELAAGGWSEASEPGGIVARHESGSDDALDPLTSALIAAATVFLDDGDIEGAAALFERLSDLETRGRTRSGLAGEVVGRAVSADHLRLLIQPSGGGETEKEGDRVQGLLAAVRPWIFEPLLEMLAEVDDRSVRKVVLELLGAEQGVPWRHLEPLLRDPRWYVVRNAVQLAASVPHMELTEHGPRLLEHSDVRVRREILRALEGIGGQTAAKAMTRALTDEDSSIRTMAARAVARDGSKEHEALLLSRIEERDFALRPTEEVEAFMAAYASLAQERAVHLLDRLWRKKFFSGRPLAFRAAALLALGRVRSPASRSVLQEASRSGEGPVKRAALSALQTLGSSSGDQAVSGS